MRYCVRVNPDLNWFSLQQWVFDTSLQKIANVIPTAAVKQSAKVLGPLVIFFQGGGGLILRTSRRAWTLLVNYACVEEFKPFLELLFKFVYICITNHGNKQGFICFCTRKEQRQKKSIVNYGSSWQITRSLKSWNMYRRKPLCMKYRKKCGRGNGKWRLLRWDLQLFHSVIINMYT